MESEEMATREILEDVIEWLTVQLKLTKATLKSTSEEFQQTQKNLETLEKEHKRVILEIAELKKQESELIKERDEAKESPRKALESLSEFENKQYVKPSAAETRVKPEKFSGSGNDTDFQAFLDQFEACARMNGWKEEEKANQLILCMKEKARVVMSQLSASDKSSYTCMVEALRKKIGMRQVPEAAKATLKARRRKVGESLLDLSIDIKRLCGEAYPTLSSASLEQACVDNFIDAIGATLAKDVIHSKPSTLDKALSEVLELKALELRAVRMSERVVSDVSTQDKEACQVQNPPLPGSATAKAAAEAVVNAIPSSGTRGNYIPPQFGLANSRGRGCWTCGSVYHFQRDCPQGNFLRTGDKSYNRVAPRPKTEYQ